MKENKLPITRKYLVTIEKEIEVIIPDEFLTEEFLADYGNMMNGYPANEDELAEDAVKLVARGYADYHNDGFGQIFGKHMMGYFEGQPKKNSHVYYDEYYEDIDLREV